MYFHLTACEIPFGFESYVQPFADASFGERPIFFFAVLVGAAAMHAAVANASKISVKPRFMGV